MHRIINPKHTLLLLSSCLFHSYWQVPGLSCGCVISCLMYCKTVYWLALLPEKLKTTSTFLVLFISLLTCCDIKRCLGKISACYQKHSINSEKCNSINGKLFCIDFKNKFPSIKACSLKDSIKCTFLRFNKILYFTNYTYLPKP